MITPAFDYDLVLDEAGVLMTRISGPFDVATYIRMRDTIIARDLAGVDISRNPVVVDLMEAQPSESDWMAQARQLWRYKRVRGARPYRRAVVFKDNAPIQMAVDFAVETMQHFNVGLPGTRIFETTAPARAWVLDGWPEYRDSVAGGSTTRADGY